MSKYRFVFLVTVGLLFQLTVIEAQAFSYKSFPFFQLSPFVAGPYKLDLELQTSQNATFEHEEIFSTPTVGFAKPSSHNSFFATTSFGLNDWGDFLIGYDERVLKTRLLGYRLQCPPSWFCGQRNALTLGGSIGFFNEHTEEGSGSFSNFIINFGPETRWSAKSSSEQATLNAAYGVFPRVWILAQYFYQRFRVETAAKITQGLFGATSAEQKFSYVGAREGPSVGVMHEFKFEKLMLNAQFYYASITTHASNLDTRREDIVGFSLRTGFNLKGASQE